MIEDIEATQALQGFCMNRNGRSFVFETERGMEVGIEVKGAQVAELMESDIGVEHLFCDICMEGFRQSEVSDEFYRDIVKHTAEAEKIAFVLYGKREKVFYGGAWRKVDPCDWRYDRIGAFVSYRILKIDGKKIVYFDAVMVYPDLQNCRYGSSLMKEVIKKEKPDLVSLRTQNPQMYSSFRKVVDVYPNGRIPPTVIVETAEVIAKKILGMENYDRKKFRGIGTYGKCIYGMLQSPVNGTEKVFRTINPFVGDCLVCLGMPK